MSCPEQDSIPYSMARFSFSVIHTYTIGIRLLVFLLLPFVCLFENMKQPTKGLVVSITIIVIIVRQSCCGGIMSNISIEPNDSMEN